MSHNRRQGWAQGHWERVTQQRPVVAQEALEGMSHNIGGRGGHRVTGSVSHNRGQWWHRRHWRACPTIGGRGGHRVTGGVSRNRGQWWHKGVSHNMAMGGNSIT
jgi:hypothetical protein